MNQLFAFLFGPSEWEIEMLIYTKNGKFSFGDLLQIPAIAKWVNENRYKASGRERSVKAELVWFIELLKISLPVVE